MLTLTSCVWLLPDIEVRLCLGAGTTVGSIGIQYLHIELSQNGVCMPLLSRRCVVACIVHVLRSSHCACPGIDYFTLYELSYPTSVGDCIAGPYLPVNGPLPSWTYNSDAQACVPKTSNYAQCAAVYLVPPVEYMYVKGRAAGVQTGELCAFGPTERFQTTGVKQRIDCAWRVACGVLSRGVMLRRHPSRMCGPHLVAPCPALPCVPPPLSSLLCCW